MRNPTIAALVFGVLLLLVSDGWTQEDNVETSAKEPLQIIDECVQAIQQREFARYVDHLSGAEQKLQAGYALYLSSSTLPQVDASSHQIEPELLLLLRALGDLIKDHTKNDLVPNADSSSAVEATNHLFLSQLIAPTITQPSVGYSTSQAVSVPKVRDVFRRSAEKALKDPRLFLIAALTEFSRPVQCIGNAPVKNSAIPSLTELVKVYDRKDWALYTRGDYALAVPMQRESVPGNQSQTKEPPLRIEFQKIDGVWKISHVLPMSMALSSPGTATGLCSGPECNAIAPNNVVPPSAPRYQDLQSHSPASSPSHPR